MCVLVIVYKQASLIYYLPEHEHPGRWSAKWTRPILGAEPSILSVQNIVTKGKYSLVLKFTNMLKAVRRHHGFPSNILMTFACMNSTCALIKLDLHYTFFFSMCVP